MEHGFDLDRIDEIVARAVPMLAAHWDGGTDRVAVIEQHGEGARMKFQARRDAAAMLRANAALNTAHPKVAAKLADMALRLDAGPVSGAVQCVLFGWGIIELIELNADDLRSPADAAIAGDELPVARAACATQEGASRAVDSARRDLEAVVGHPLAELEQLAAAITHRWHDVSAIAMATARARALADRYLGTRQGQRVRLVVTILAEVAAARGGARGPTSGGGSA